MRQDLVYAIRMLARRPGFAIAAVLSLALGIGATTAIFTIVNAVALRPLPYSNPDQLVWFTELLHGSSTDAVTMTPHFLEWRRQAKSFASLAAYQYNVDNLTGLDTPLEVHTARVSASLLPMIGVEPMIGRNFTAKEDSKGNNRVVILTEALWRDHLGSDPHITGRPIVIDAIPFTVVGVLPRSFVFPGTGSVDLLTPLGKDEAAELAMNPTAITIISNVLGRLNPGVTPRQATAELDTINARLPHPPWTKKITIDMQLLRDRLYGNANTAGWILLAAAGFLLWIACANTSNLLLARLTQRDRELSIRAVLGGSRGRLIAQLMTESALLSVLACGTGIAIAWLLRAPILALSPYKLAGLDDLPFDWRVLAFAVGSGVLTVLIFGVLPAFRATQDRLAQSIKAGESTMTGGRGSIRILSTIAALEIATLLVLSTGAGVMLKSFWKLRYQNLGISADHLTAVRIIPSNKNDAQRFEFDQQLLERVQSIPGVEAAAFTDELPPGGGHAMNVFEIEGRPAAIDSGNRPIARYPRASPELFSILQIPLLQGRLFTPSDRFEVAVINRALADKYFRGENPIGRRIRWGGNDQPWFEIIGMVGDVKLSSLEAKAEPAIYYGYNRTDALWVIGLILKSPLSTSVLAPQLRQVVASLDPNQPISSIESLNARLTESVAKPRFTAAMLLAFAALAMILGIIGVYGVVSCRVRWQMRELAVRQALGAQPADVVRHVLNQGLWIVVAGISGGIAASLALSRVLARLLYEVKPNDPWTLGGVALLLTIVAMAACWIPARRAARVDPLVLLRYE